MSLNYRQVASCRPSAASDVYIFTILPIADRGIAAITSNNHLYLLDSTTLQPSHTVPPNNLPNNLTSLAVADDGYSTICAGADGVVATFDVRTRAQVGHFQTGTSTFTSPIHPSLPRSRNQSADTDYHLQANPSTSWHAEETIWPWGVKLLFQSGEPPAQHPQFSKA